MRTDKANFSNRAIFFLICAAVVVFTMFYGTVHQPAIALFYLTVTAMWLFWAWDSFRTGSFTISRHLLQVPLFAAALFAFVQMIPFGWRDDAAGVAGVGRTLTMSPFDTQMTMLHMLALALFFSVVLTSVSSAARLSKLVTFISVFGFVYAFFAILQSFLSPGKIYGIYERAGASPFGTFVSRHNFAAFAEMTLALPLGMLLSGAVKRDKKLLYITAIVLIGTALLMSGSRGGLVAMAAAVMLLIFLTTRAKGYKAIAVRGVLAVLLVAVVVAGTIYIGGESSLTRIAETATSKDVTTDRLHIWKTTLKVINANFPLGAGIGAFAQAYTQFDDRGGLERVEQAHNDYLQVLADAGIVGAAIFAFFLWALYKTVRRALKEKNGFRRGAAVGAIGGIFAVLVHSVFDFVLHTTAITVMFILLLVILIASARSYTDDIEDDENARHRHRTKGIVTAFGRRRSASR